MISVTVLFLGPAKDYGGTSPLSLTLKNGATIAEVRAEIARRLPALGRALPTMRVAVNQAFATDDATLHGGEEVALIPPVSGG